MPIATRDSGWQAMMVVEPVVDVDPAPGRRARVLAATFSDRDAVNGTSPWSTRLASVEA